mgnify:CR=1 FL=1
MSLCNILITRPIDDAKITAKELEALGLTPIISPLLSIHMRPITSEASFATTNSPMGTIIISSSNAIRAIARYKIPTNTQLITVGKRSEKIAKELGFTNVSSANGNVIDLILHIKTHFKPEQGKLIYASADVITTDLDTQLRNIGYDIERVIVYESRPVQEFSNNTISLIKERKINALTFYSQETAKHFLLLLEHYKLTAYTTNIVVFCMSQAIAKWLQKAQFHTILYPKHPNSDSMLELIANFRFTVGSIKS